MTTIRRLLREKSRKIYSVGPDSTVYDAIRTMAENIGSLVVMEGNKIMGIITECTKRGVERPRIACNSRPRHYGAQSAVCVA